MLNQNTHVLIYNTHEQFESMQALSLQFEMLSGMFQNNMVLSTDDIAEWYKLMSTVKQGVEALEGDLSDIVTECAINAEDAAMVSKALHDNQGVLPWMEDK